VIAGVVGYLYLSRLYRTRRNQSYLKAVYESTEREYEEIAAIA
jgi:hypothetical protein